MTRVLLALVLCAGTARAEEPRPKRDRIVALAAATALLVGSETVLKNSLVPAACSWCEPNALDRGVRDAIVWDDTAQPKSWSNITGFVLEPVVSMGLLAVAGLRDRDQPLRLVNDLLPVAEAYVYTELVTNAVKYTVARQRPEVHFSSSAGSSPGRATSTEDNLSFFSGHTSGAFSIAVAAGMVAHARRTPFEPVVWAAGLALAETTGYLRIAGDKHYFTDVLAGAAVGAAGGWLIPRLTGGLHRARVVPSPGGLALAGAF
jgi:membrane-associated phospholipid phosphatase